MQPVEPVRLIRLADCGVMQERLLCSTLPAGCRLVRQCGSLRQHGSRDAGGLRSRQGNEGRGCSGCRCAQGPTPVLHRAEQSRNGSFQAELDRQHAGSTAGDGYLLGPAKSARHLPAIRTGSRSGIDAISDQRGWLGAALGRQPGSSRVTRGTPASDCYEAPVNTFPYFTIESQLPAPLLPATRPQQSCESSRAARYLDASFCTWLRLFASKVIWKKSAALR